MQQPRRHEGIMADQRSPLLSDPGPTSGTPQRRRPPIPADHSVPASTDHRCRGETAPLPRPTTAGGLAGIRLHRARRPDRRCSPSAGPRRTVRHARQEQHRRALVGRRFEAPRPLATGAAASVRQHHDASMPGPTGSADGRRSDRVKLRRLFLEPPKPLPSMSRAATGNASSGSRPEQTQRSTARAPVPRLRVPRGRPRRRWPAASCCRSPGV